MSQEQFLSWMFDDNSVKRGAFLTDLPDLLALLQRGIPVKLTRVPIAGCEDIDIPLPDHKHEGDAGADLRAYFPEPEIKLAAGEQSRLSSGWALAELPFGTVMDVRSKSGAVGNLRVSIANSPGTVDAGYRGQIMLLVENRGPAEVTIRRGQALGQLVILPVFRGVYEEVGASEVQQTDRGVGGFGSTGMR